MMPPCSNPYSLAGGACFALAGAACDLRRRRIPNYLTGAAFLAALAVNGLFGGPRALLDSLAAGLLAGALFAVMFFMGGMGGGDVKLMAAIAAFAGLGRLAEVLLYTTLAGGVLALGVAFYRRAIGSTMRRMFAWAMPGRLNASLEGNVAAQPLYVPYGVAIAAGALLTFYRGVVAS